MQLDLALPDTGTSIPKLAIAFRSGMSRSKDFWAAAGAGVAIGVVAGELSFATRITGLSNYLRAGGSVFIDTGAFSELKTGIEPDFDDILSLYQSLALDKRDVCGRLYIVSPDKVGDQLETLARIERYGARLHQLIEAGCKLIVPIQCGAIPAAEMLAKVAAILGTRQFVAGIPSNKAAMSIQECASLNHHSYHILGRVQMDADQAARMCALARGSSDVVITADANWLRSRLGTVTQLGRNEHAQFINDTGHTRLVKRSPRAVAIRAALASETTWAA